MPRIPERKTAFKMLSIALVLALGAGGIFFVLAPYQASRVRADLMNRFYAQGGGPLVLATAAEDGAYYELGTLLRQHLDASQSYKIEVQSTQGSVDNLRLLEEDSADLALIQGGLAASRGSTASDSNLLGGTTSLVALANLGRQYVHVVVPADSDIREFRDLAGKRLGVGPSGGGAEAMARRVTGFFRFGEPATLIENHNADLSEAFLDGEIDAAFTVYGLFAPAMENLLASGWYRLVPVAEAEAVSRYLPGVFAEILPPFLYGPDRSMPSAESGPFQTLSVNTLLVCQSDLPDRQVYTVLEEIFSGPFLKLARLTDLDEAKAQLALHVPLHRAAEAFYNRRNPISSDRFEILSFFLAGLVCLASALHYLVGRRRMAIQAHRRVAIRPYFEAMMDFGDSVENASSPSSLTCLIHKIMATQRGAERKWLEGEFDTEDMENLYAVYSLRCNNAFNKIFDLHLQAMRGVAVAEIPRELDDDPPARPLIDDTRGRDRAWQTSSSEARPWSRSEETYTSTYSAVPRDDADDDFFSGGPLAGIDQTKKDMAQMLPSRFDSELLYDTEASGAGAVRVRSSKPAAELQATVERSVPDRTPDAPVVAKVAPTVAPEAAPKAVAKPDPVHRVAPKADPVRKATPKASPARNAAPKAESVRNVAPKPAPVEEAEQPALDPFPPINDPSHGPLDVEPGPDQMMLF